MTGRNNYTLAAKDFGEPFVEKPELVAEPRFA
ncbi:hypothetical protein [Siphonobacter curvatus]